VSKQDKKKIRAAFRDAVFSRDGYCCKGCGEKGTAETLDAHHVTNRDLMPNGGYVAENGITLCKKSGGCHEIAEAWSEDNPTSVFSPEELYIRIGSTYERAVEASKKLRAER
jgi:5-methylcytosine-specific restriction endonuclease McrA